MRRRWRRLKPNPVLTVLIGAIMLALGLTGFVAIAPNRIVSGRPVAFWEAVPASLGLLLPPLILALAFVAVLDGRVGARRSGFAQVVLAFLCLILLVMAAGRAAGAALEVAAPAARVSLGAGFWIAALCSALAMADGLMRLGIGPSGKALWGLACAALLAAIAASGALGDLSLMREFAARSDQFAAALTRHFVLVLGSFLPACLIGVPLGLLAFRRPGSAGAVFATLNLVQTIPSIAFFAVLIEPLTLLSSAIPALRSVGVAGIGLAPALIALTAYALLPVARTVEAAFAAVPADALDAARGMGMARREVLVQVALPLAAPVLLSGLRIVVIQLIGLAVVAALIGAGGLGTFVFQGLGQTATDLVLVGALSAIALALLSDALLRAAAWPLESGYRR